MSFVVILDQKIQITTLSEIIPQLSGSICIYTRCDLIKDIEDSGIKDYEFFDIDKIKKRYLIRKYFHKLLLVLFTKSDYSFQYKMVKKKYTFSLYHKLLNILTYLTPKVKNSNINLFVTKMMSLIFVKIPFKHNKIICTSLNSSAFLLANKKLEIVTVMESWDHAVKVPNGFVSKYVFCWNDSLRKDWKNKQGDKTCLIHYPAKLRFSKEVSLKENSNKNQVVYVAATTKRFSLSTIYSIELKILKELVNIFRNSDYELVIKLRPNGSTDDFDELGHDLKKVGIQEHDISYAPDYIINTQYNDTRFIELKNCKFVINTFSTFGIDCVLAGLPVVQIDLSNTKNFEESAEIYSRPHIKNYLINYHGVLKPKCIDELSILIESNIEDLKFNDELNKWLDYPIEKEKVINNTCNFINQNL